MGWPKRIRKEGKGKRKIRKYYFILPPFPPPPSFIYVGRGHLEHTPIVPSHVRCPPQQFTPPDIFSWCLGEALRGSLHHHRHHAIVLTELIYFLDTLLDQDFEGCHQAECVQNSEVSYVRYLIGRNEKKFDYINRVVKRFRLWSMRVHRHTLPLVAMHLLDRSCVSVGFF